MAEVFKVEGLADLQRALKELPKATGKNALRRALLKAAEPIAEDAAKAAPDDPATAGFDLHTSVVSGTKLSRRQRRQHRKQGEVEAFVGAGPLPQAHLNEFGSSHQRPQPFMRPAWEANKEKAVKSIADDLAGEIEKARKRLARKAARVAREN
jgi:HK97 gp10 family phage protein